MMKKLSECKRLGFATHYTGPLFKCNALVCKNKVPFADIAFCRLPLVDHHAHKMRIKED